MPLCTAALLPHSPLLIPEIGRANHGFLVKTIGAYQSIAAALIDAGAETIIIISPHAAKSRRASTINVAPEMTIDFKEFGFIPPRVVFAGDAILADQIKTALRPDFPVEIISETTLDQGSAVPLYLLRGEGKAKIVIVSPAADLKREELSALGERLRTVIDSSDKQTAIIASGDLSHRLKKKSPGGYSPKGAKFDNRLIEILSQPASAAAEVVALDENLVTDAGECGLAPLTVLLGALNRQPWQPEVLAYQTDFGVGYLSFRFQL